MLSGVEIAGLLLAIIPIFQAAAEQEDTIFESAKIALRPKYGDRKLEEFYKDLNYEVSVLRSNVERLVDELADLRESDRTALKNGDESLWSESRVEAALRRRLRTGYDSFCIHLNGVHEKLEKVVKESAAGLPAQISDPSATTSKLDDLRSSLKKGKTATDLKGRLKFAWKEEKRRALIQKIGKYNKRLLQLLGPAPPFEPEQKQSRWEVTTHLQLRPLMHILHTTMGGLWPCDCSRPHEARLCLLKSTKPPGPVADHPAGGIYFDLMLSSIRTDATQEFCMWLESKICVVLKEQLPQSSPSTVKFALSTPPASPDRQLARTLSGMTFASTNSIVSTATAVSTSTTLVNQPISPPISPVPSNNRKRVKNICKTLLEAKTRYCCPRLLFDEEAGVLYQMLATPQKMSIEASQPSQSLASLLQGQRQFTLKEQRILGVILAHSLLHFCESPWMSREWNKDHITFFQRAQAERVSSTNFDLTRPWLAPTFGGKLLVTPEIEEAEEAYLFSRRMHANPSVLALGILLLEIELNTTIEEKGNQGDTNSDFVARSNANFLTAMQLIDHTSDEHIFDKVPENIAQAIQACIKCDFVAEGQSSSLDDEYFREAVYREIVRPLEDELWHSFKHLKPEDIGLEAVAEAKR